MKKLLLLISISISMLSFAQWAVYDAGANYQMAQQVASSGKQLYQLQQVYKLAKETEEKYKQVNGYLQSMGQLQNIIRVQKEAINNANLCIKKARQKKINVQDVSNNLAQISGSIKTVTALLQNNIFKMDDSQRIQLLENEYEKSQSASTAIKVKLIKLSY